MKREKYYRFLGNFTLQRIFPVPILLAVVLIVMGFLFDCDRGCWLVLFGRMQPMGGSVLLEFTNAVNYGMYYPFALIFLTIPFAGAFCEEWNSGVCLYLLHPMSKRRYTMYHVGISAFSGGAAYALGTAVFLALLCFRYPFFDGEYIGNYNMNGMGKLLSQGEYSLYVAGILLLFFLYGFMAGGIASAVSSFITNRYVVAVAPYFLYRSYIEIVKQVGLPDRFRPDYLLISKGDLPYSPGQLIIIDLLFAVVTMLLCCFLFQMNLKRRLENEKD